jgi:hypothetical protein
VQRDAAPLQVLDHDERVEGRAEQAVELGRDNGVVLRKERFLGGTVPFGFRRAGEDGELLVRHEAEQEAIGEIKRLKAHGKALRAISEALRAKGHRISHEGVSRVLRTQRAG